MKRFLLIIAACFPAIGLLAADVEPMSTDTVIRLENKRIVVKDNSERMKVKVYELTEEGDSIDSEMIFEGHYRDGQSYERRKHIKSINIPIPTGPASAWGSPTFQVVKGLMMWMVFRSVVVVRWSII